ncbi:hypothetical protein [Pseudomonas sp. Q1-7]|uniref:hypothetical protein n=1 Tax=Pseudomonas sp. Q1-7 TaxID=3020843 RepID=UPI002300E735|nr:hypothetical protein [Pseudomonas sp. Q1-7]
MSTLHAQARGRLPANHCAYAFQLGFEGVAFMSPESALREFRRAHHNAPDADAWRDYSAGAAAARAERVELRMTPERFRDYQFKKAKQDGQDESPAVQP